MTKQLWQIINWKEVTSEDIDLFFNSHYDVNECVPEEEFGIYVNPLFYAIYDENYQAIRALLKKGANPNAILKSLDETLPDVHLLECVYSPKIRKLMMEYGAQIPKKPSPTPPPEPSKPEPTPKEKRPLFIPERPKGKMTKEMRQKWAAEFIRHNF